MAFLEGFIFPARPVISTKSFSSNRSFGLPDARSRRGRFTVWAFSRLLQRFRHFVEDCGRCTRRIFGLRDGPTHH